MIRPQDGRSDRPQARYYIAPALGIYEPHCETCARARFRPSVLIPMSGQHAATCVKCGAVRPAEEVRS